MSMVIAKLTCIISIFVQESRSLIIRDEIFCLSIAKNAVNGICKFAQI